MQSAREAVQQFVAKSGHHDTTVDETIRPAVIEEKIQPIRREEVITAVDKEVHQDHYHTTVQPLQDREVLPEKHEHHILPVKQRTFEHEDKGKTRASLDQIAAKFHSTTITRETQHVTAALPTVTGERVHHHVHEVVQPVIYKETIVPHVVHTTIPIHEVHHAPVQHHGISTLPIKPISEFIASGGSTKGHVKADSGHYEGPPRPYNKDLLTEIPHGHISSQTVANGRQRRGSSSSSSSSSSASDTSLTHHSTSTNTTAIDSPRHSKRNSSGGLRAKLDHILHPSKSKSRTGSQSSQHNPLSQAPSTLNGTRANVSPHSHAPSSTVPSAAASGAATTHLR